MAFLCHRLRNREAMAKQDKGLMTAIARYFYRKNSHVQDHKIRMTRNFSEFTESKKFPTTWDFYPNLITGLNRK